jgi:hypothetical protein
VGRTAAAQPPLQPSPFADVTSASGKGGDGLDNVSVRSQGASWVRSSSSSGGGGGSGGLPTPTTSTTATSSSAPWLSLLLSDAVTPPASTASEPEHDQSVSCAYRRLGPGATLATPLLFPAGTTRESVAVSWSSCQQQMQTQQQDRGTPSAQDRQRDLPPPEASAVSVATVWCPRAQAPATAAAVLCDIDINISDEAPLLSPPPPPAPASAEGSTTTLGSLASASSTKTTTTVALVNISAVPEALRVSVGTGSDASAAAGSTRVELLPGQRVVLPPTPLSSGTPHAQALVRVWPLMLNASPASTMAPAPPPSAGVQATGGVGDHLPGGNPPPPPLSGSTAAAAGGGGLPAGAPVQSMAPPPAASGPQRVLPTALRLSMARAASLSQAGIGGSAAAGLAVPWVPAVGQQPSVSWGAGRQS